MHMLLLTALLKGPAVTPAPEPHSGALLELAKALGERARRKLGRSLADPRGRCRLLQRLRA